MTHKRFEDAACAVLKEKRRPMKCQEIIDEVLTHHLWSRREQAKPQTLYNSLYGTLIKATQKSRTNLKRKDNTDTFYVLRYDHANSIPLPALETKQQTSPRSPSGQTEKEQFIEGDIREITLELKKRDKKLKKLAIESYGLSCQICGFNFQDVYGPLGSGYIEIHHLELLSKQQGRIATEINDVTVVCANCHRILHRHVGQLVPIESLRQSIKSQKKKQLG